MRLKTCVSPEGKFVYGVHKPAFRVENLRQHANISSLGTMDDGTDVRNRINFPGGHIEENEADWVFEIPNPFPFRGTTYILKRWADENARHPELIRLPEQPSFSFFQFLKRVLTDTEGTKSRIDDIYKMLPRPMRLSIAVTSTDPEDLTRLARLSADFVFEPTENLPKGLCHTENGSGRILPVIHDHQLFDALGNNPYLPDDFKDAMVLRPGIQGTNEIMGDYTDPDHSSHVFEYLRRNSYIPWGHFAANMASDAVRYHVNDLLLSDIKGMRHLYYQRTYVRLADQVGLVRKKKSEPLSTRALESLRRRVLEKLTSDSENMKLSFNRTLWGWNYGFDYAPSGYRLHASHQQIHQQYAMIPSAVDPACECRGDMDSHVCLPSFACGDLIGHFMEQYAKETGTCFFEDYIAAIRNNRRMDGSEQTSSSLIVYEDDHVMVFVPKAQTSQWELQLMVLSPIGNILEADDTVRASIDLAMLILMKILTELGAAMITCIEYSTAFDSDHAGQRLLYAFLPRLPESPGAFSEAQLRWINGHYPEDFARACRRQLNSVLEQIR